jgi:2,5-diketo-D-gluconate reductase B
MEHLTLPSGAQMPVIGLGTYQQHPDYSKSVVDCEIIIRALKAGFRHIDSAIFYETHKEIRRALQESDIDRSEIFITTKVYRNKLGYDDMLAECEKSLGELDTDYLDLYLVHWPNKEIPMEETFRAMGRLIEEGSVRDMGVANFSPSNLRKALDTSQTQIAINQVEFHPLLYQEKLLRFCEENGVKMTAYAPIAQTRVLDEPVLQNIGRAHNRSPIQISLRWLVQKGLSAVPKASSEAHLAANLDLFDWELTDGEMQRIDAIGKNQRLFDWEEVGEFSKDA